MTKPIKYFFKDFLVEEGKVKKALKKMLRSTKSRAKAKKDINYINRRASWLSIKESPGSFKEAERYFTGVRKHPPSEMLRPRRPRLPLGVIGKSIVQISIAAGIIWALAKLIWK